MTTFDYGRPFIGDGDLGSFVALDRKIARRYGEIVKATELSSPHDSRLHCAIE